MKTDIMKIEGQTGLTATGWDLKGVTESQWNEAGEILVKVDQARQWWLGDWWNACQWGDGKAACEALGINYQTARDCGFIAASFQMSRRRDKLSFSHHREVCPVDDPTMQDKLLDWAEAERASVKALRERVNNHLSLTRTARRIIERTEEAKIELTQTLSDARELLGNEKYDQWFQAEIATQPRYQLAVEIGIL